MFSANKILLTSYQYGIKLRGIPYQRAIEW